MKIGIDLDGTVFQTYERMAEVYELETGKVFDLSLITKWNKEFSVLRWIQKYYRRPNCYNIAPYPNAIKVLRELAKRHELYFIVYRRPEVEEETRRIMKSYGFDRRIVFVPRPYKLETYIFLADLVLEDELETALKLLKHKIKVILFHRPWNHQKHYDYCYGFRRIKDWKEVYQAGKELFEWTDTKTT